MCAASDSSAREWASTPATTSPHMNARISTPAAASQRAPWAASSQAPSPWWCVCPWPLLMTNSSYPLRRDSCPCRWSHGARPSSTDFPGQRATGSGGWDGQGRGQADMVGEVAGGGQGRVLIREQQAAGLHRHAGTGQDEVNAVRDLAGRQVLGAESRGTGAAERVAEARVVQEGLEQRIRPGD